MATQLEEVRRIYEVTKSSLEAKEKEYLKMEEEIVGLRKELEKCQDELKTRIKYEGSTEALDKILSKQKNSKDIGGVGFDVGKCSTSKDSTNKEIHFVSSSDNGGGQTFTVRNAPRKKIDLSTTTKSIKDQVATAARNNNVDSKRERKVE